MPGSEEHMETVLAMKGLTKRYGARTVVNTLDFEVRRVGFYE